MFKSSPPSPLHFAIFDLRCMKENVLPLEAVIVNEARTKEANRKECGCMTTWLSFPTPLTGFCKHNSMVAVHVTSSPIHKYSTALEHQTGPKVNPETTTATSQHQCTFAQTTSPQARGTMVGGGGCKRRSTRSVSPKALTARTETKSARTTATTGW